MKHNGDIKRGAHEARYQPLSGNGGGVAASDHNQGQGLFLRRVSVFGAAGAILIALFGLLGYVPGLGLFGNVSEGYIPMAPSTAISFIVLGGILLAMTLRSLSTASLVFLGSLAALVSLFGALEIVGHFIGRDLNLEDALVPSAGYLGEIPIARMSPATGAAFLLAGLAVLALSLRSTTRSRRALLKHWGGCLGSLVLIVGLVFCLAYFYGSPLLYGRGATVPMALTTSLAFLMLGAATVGVSGEDAIPVSLLARAKRAGTPIGGRKRFLFLVLIMVGACAMVMAVITVMLYRHHIQEHRGYLQATARSQARLIEAVARYDLKMADIVRAEDPDYDASAATLSQIIDAYERYEGFGETGEFMLARRDEDSMVFVLRHRNGAVEHPGPVAFDSDLAEPMRRALKGLSGTVIGLDYRGETVLAAHMPAATLNLGIVVKINLAEIRAPFIRSGLSAAAVALLVVLAGTALFFWIGNPIIERLEAHSRDLEKEVEERKLAEEALRESNMRLLRAQHVSNMGFLDWNMKTNDMYWSEEVYRIYGIDPETTRSSIDLTMELLHPDDLEFVEKNIKLALDGEKEYDIDHRIVRPSGNVIWVHAQAELSRDAEGEPERFLGTVVDITERKKLGDELKSFFDVSADLMCVASPAEGRFTKVNPACLRILGRCAEEMSSRPFEEFIHPDDRESTRKTVAKQLEGNPVAFFENRYQHKDGSYRFLSWTATPVMDAQVFAVARDITDRKRAEEALRASEERFRTMFSEAPLGMALIDSLTGRIYEVNPRCAEIVGRTREEMVTIDWMSITHPDDVQESLDNMALLNAGEIPGFNIQKRCIRPDGSFVWIHMTIAPVKAKDTGHPRHLCMIEDVTARLAAEKENQELEVQLRQAQKMEAIGTLAGGIAHDFNNILTAVIMNAEVALMEELTKDHPAAHSVKEALTAANRAKDLVKQILTFSRQTEEGSRVIRVTSIVKEVLKFLRASLPSTIEICQDLSAPHDTVLADPTRLHQVLMNLCTNAAHAMRQDGGELKVALEEILLSPSEAHAYEGIKPGPYLKLTIEDTGHGMPRSVMERVFEPYYTTKKVGEGTGLGLAVVHGIVKGLNGAIAVASEEGKGSVFTILLQLVGQESEEDIGVQASPLPTGTERILFVDDEEAVGKVATRVLKGLGYTVHTETNSLQALELFRADPKRFDLVITDLTMPGMTGDRLATQMTGIRPDIPIILCTGDGELGQAERAKGTGGRELMMKPFLRHDLAKFVRRVLDSR